MGYNFDIYDDETLHRSVLQEFDLTDDEVKEIQFLNFRIEVLQQMINNPKTSNTATSRLVDELTATRIKYKQWFVKMQTKFNIIETNHNKLNVVFHHKKLQLIG